MKNIVMIGGERAVISADAERKMFRGEFIGLNGGADFYADSYSKLIEEGEQSLAIFFELCREKGIEPRRNFSGRFNLRLSPEDHEAAVAAAAAEGVSLNDWIAGAIRTAAA